MITEAGLNHTFGIPGALIFEQDAGGLLFARMATAAGTASLSLQGGHLLSWQSSACAEPVLWMSKQARFAVGKSIRGGVPVCWPWFGPHATDPSLPAHGFARIAQWSVTDSDVNAQGEVSITLALQHDLAHETVWPHSANLSLTVTLGESLRMQLETRNSGMTPFVLGEALHTYFNISDIEAVAVHGLEGGEYWDTVGGVEKKRQAGPIQFSAETDRVYINSDAATVIEDPGYARRIHIAKRGSLATVVWNPWTDKANRMGDLGQPDGWRQMLCVESANAWDNKITLAPGAVHTLDVAYRVETI